MELDYKFRERIKDINIFLKRETDFKKRQELKQERSILRHKLRELFGSDWNYRFKRK